MTRSLFVFFVVFLGICDLARGQLKDIAALRAQIPAAQDSVQLLDTYLRLGTLYINRSLDSCHYFGANALDLAGSIADKHRIAEALSILAFYYMEKGKSYLAYKYIVESLTHFEQLGADEKVCETTMNIGVLLGREGKTEQALLQFEKAYQLSQLLERDSIQSLIILNMVLPKALHTNLPLPELERLCDQAQAIAAKHGDERILLAIRLTRTTVKSIKGMDVNQLIEEQRDVIRETEKKGYEYHTALSYMGMGNLFLGLDVDSALHYYETAITLAKNTGYDVLHHHTVNQAYEAPRNQHPIPAKANEYAHMLLEISRQAQTESREEEMGFMELAVKEQEIELAKEKYLLRRMWLVLLVVICLLALAFIGVVFRQYRLKRRLAANLKITNEQLERKNSLLETNNEFHQKLISMLSHDLRQPLSSILMIQEQAVLERMGKDELLYVFEQVHGAANMGLQVLDGLLNWMKFRVVGLVYSPAIIRLRENMEEALAFHSALVRQKRISVMLFVPDTCAVQAQPEMLLFVNRNIIHNAIKHMPEDGQLVITAKQGDDDGMVHVCVSDNGEGIPEELFPHLFQKNQPAGQQSAMRGSGLALIICHEMITAMNGNLWAANNEDGGASFHYRLPAASARDN